MRKPIIGLTIQYTYEENRVRFSDRYILAIENAGGIPLLLPEIKSKADARVYTELCDGFVFTGGADIDPAHYGEERLPACGQPQPSRDAFEFMLFSLVLASGKPILGICRGIQTMNVALGGSLYQDIQGHNGPASHLHTVYTAEGSKVQAIFGAESFLTNTWHHQALKTLGRELVVTAKAEDGTIEAIEWPAHPFFIGLQWHPEASWGNQIEVEYSPKIFYALMEACRKA